MKQSALLRITLAIWALVAALVIGIVFAFPPDLNQLHMALLFGLLIILSDTFSIPSGGGYISLLPMIVMTTFLVLGLSYSSLLVFIASIVHALVRWFGSEPLGLPRLANKRELVRVVSANGTMLTVSIIVSGFLFERWFDVRVPLMAVSRDAIVPLSVFILLYFAVNYALAAAFFRLLRRDEFDNYLSGLSTALLYEMTAMPFAPLIALIYTRLGTSHFVMFALALSMASLVMHNLEQVKQGLERRVRELSSLQAIGQALSSSLELDKVLTAVYQQVSKLMPTNIFFVALYDEAKNEVSFPIALQDDIPLNWHSRPLGNGLTDYIIRNREPLLIRHNMVAMLDELEVNLLGGMSQSWLGVPIVAGDQILGVLSVQSEHEVKVFNKSHQKVLMTIATQAAVAIQNAHLYTQTDKALAQRVRELDSILTTAQEGMLLLDNQWAILTVNRAFRTSLALEGAQIEGQSLTTWSQGETTLLARIDYTLAELEADCERLLSGQIPHIQKQVTLSGSAERHFQRQLSPVYEHDETVAGWLLVLHDVTEEVELEQLRQEMTHMLVHDLRSPLSIMKGSIEVLKGELEALELPLIESLVEYMESSSDRLLKLVEDVLDIHQFESGAVPLQRDCKPVDELFANVREQFTLMLKELNLTLLVEMADDLPDLSVDSDYLGRVLTNLVDNAIKYTEDNGRICLWAKMAEGNMILVGVDDTGMGIPPSVQSQMFQKFHKDLGGKGRRKGSGLGLSFCKLVIEAHGGQIWVESRGVPGEGSRFVMQLPTCE